MAKPTSLLILFALIFGLPLSRVVAQGAKTPTAADKRKAEIAAIKKYENEVLFDTLSHPATLRQFVKVSPTASWKEVKPSAKRTQPFLAASIGFRAGKPVFVSIHHRGKNQKTPDSSILLFRPDGTLAKYILVVEVRSNNSLLIEKIKVQYFDAKGQSLLTIIGSKKQKARNFTDLKSLSVPELPVCLKVQQIPFYLLLKNKNAGATKVAPTPSPAHQDKVKGATNKRGGAVKALFLLSHKI